MCWFFVGHNGYKVWHYCRKIRKLIKITMITIILIKNQNSKRLVGVCDGIGRVTPTDICLLLEPSQSHACSKKYARTNVGWNEFYSSNQINHLLLNVFSIFIDNG